jgi:hypothetical protein
VDVLGRVFGRPPPPLGLVTATFVVDLTLAGASVLAEMPLLGGAWTLTGNPSEVELGANLLVTLSTSDLQAASSGPALTTVAGGAAVSWPPTAATAVLDVWYVETPTAVGISPLPIRVLTIFGGQPGIHLWTLSMPSGGWVDDGPMTLNGIWLEGASMSQFAAVALVEP